MQFINKKNGLNVVQDKYAEYVCNRVTDLVKDKLYDFIKEYYQEYSPEQYERTWKFLNSLVQTKAELVGNKWIATVYIDTSIQYSSTWNGEHWDVGNTAYMANKGLHGNTKVGDQKFFHNAYREILSDKHLTSSLFSFIKKQGLSVKYKTL